MQHIIKTENFLIEFVRGFHCTSNFCIPAYTNFSYSNKSTSIFHHNLLHSENKALDKLFNHVKLMNVILDVSI